MLSYTELMFILLTTRGQKNRPYSRSAAENPAKGSKSFLMGDFIELPLVDSYCCSKYELER